MYKVLLFKFSHTYAKGLFCQINSGVTVHQVENHTHIGKKRKLMN